MRQVKHRPNGEIGPFPGKLLKTAQKKGPGRKAKSSGRCEHRYARGEVRCITRLTIEYVIPSRNVERITVIYAGKTVNKRGLQIISMAQIQLEIFRIA